MLHLWLIYSSVYIGALLSSDGQQSRVGGPSAARIITLSIKMS